MEKIKSEVMGLLEELEDVIENSQNVPFSNKAMIDRGDILDIIKKIRISLPTDMKQADWVQREKDKIIDLANEEAQKILETTEEFCKKSASEHEITKLAEQNAEEILESAHINAKIIKEGARDYSVDMLEKLIENLSKIQSRIESNKKELEDFDL